MIEHIDETRLSDFAEGLLTGEEEFRVEEHLATCARCREAVQAIRVVREELGGLPGEAMPSRDLWPGIAARIQAGVGEASAPAAEESEEADPTVIPLDSRRTRPHPEKRFSGWHLAAASIAVAIISGGTVWYMLSAGGADRVPGGDEVPSAVRAVAFESTVAEYESAVADLQAILDAGKEVLEPETLGVLEESLQTIDRAIQESREALANDPGSGILGRLVAENMKRKLALLRQAAILISREA